MLWDNNHFSVGGPHLEYGLRQLLAANRRQCFGLQKLSVCLRWWPSRPPYHSKYFERDKIDSHTMSLWTSAITHILGNVPKRQLSLYLICQDITEEERNAVLAPLRAFRGKLKHLALTFGYKYESTSPETTVEYIVKDILAEEAKPSTQLPFRFFDLPAETRHQILCLTDLVTPTGEVIYITGDFYHPLKIEFVDEAEDWTQASFEANTKKYVYVMCHARSDCFAYLSGYSSSCTCWKPPSSLMPVSKAMYLEAMRVLYGENRITIREEFDDWRHDDEHIYERTEEVAQINRVEHMEVSSFILRHSVPGVLGYLQDVEFVLPDIDLSSIQDLNVASYIDQDTYQHWCCAVGQLARYCRPSGLQVTVHINGSQKLETYNALLESRGRKEVFLARHFRLLAPFRQMSQMSTFSYTSNMFGTGVPAVAFGSTRRRSGKNWWDSTRGRDVYPWPRFDLFEEWLEKQIMGSGYDAAALGKYDQVPSGWLEDEMTDDWVTGVERVCHKRDYFKVALYPEGRW